MMSRLFYIVPLCAAPLFFTTHADSASCSCHPPLPWMLSPARDGKAPLNTQIRVALPTYYNSLPSLRKYRGDYVMTFMEDIRRDSLGYFNLIPQKPLEPNTRYEVYVDRSSPQDPRILVFGTFVTGDATDTKAPTAPKIEKVTPNPSRGKDDACYVYGSWIQFSTSEARDPGRDDARLTYAAWVSYAKGKLDVARMPDGYAIPTKDGTFTLGQSSRCDANEFPLPTEGEVTLGIAAVDEAGNKSAVKRVKLDMHGLYVEIP